MNIEDDTVVLIKKKSVSRNDEYQLRKFEKVIVEIKEDIANFKKRRQETQIQRI